MILPKLNICGSNPSTEELNLFTTYKIAGNVLLETDKDTPFDEVLIPLITSKYVSTYVQFPKYSDSEEMAKAILKVLDGGANKVIIPLTQDFPNEELVEKISQFPEDRLGLIFKHKSQKETLNAINQFNSMVSMIIIENTNDLCPFPDKPDEPVSQTKNFNRELYVKELTQLKSLAKKAKIYIDLQSVNPTEMLIANLDEIGLNLVLPSQKIAIGTYEKEVNGQEQDGKIDIGTAFTASLVTDRPDGLYSTLVVDEQGVALGLAYSDTQSLSEAFRTRQGVYKSRSRGLWYKGLTSSATQQLLRVDADCDKDTIRFTVHQTASGFCHLNTRTCFGEDSGITALEAILKSRYVSAPKGSYTKRLFDDTKLLHSKIMEEAGELCEATEKDEIAWEAADVIFFALTKCVANGVYLCDIENHLDRRSKKITRRPGNAKPLNVPIPGVTTTSTSEKTNEEEKEKEINKEKATTSSSTTAATTENTQLDFSLNVYDYSVISQEQKSKLEKRPIISSSNINDIVKPIIENVRKNGDEALKEYTEKFDHVKLDSVVIEGPFNEIPSELAKETIDAIDLAYDNLVKFHAAQLDLVPLHVETTKGVNCSRYVRPIERVGIYVPGGTAVLPSTTMHLGVPAKVAGCSKIIIATPPRKDGSIVPEVLYVAKKINASMIVKAGGAQAVAAMAYGTQTIPKVDKICGPGNQFVTAAKMLVQNDHSALVSIDMPAGPSEVLVIADNNAKASYVAADLLSQAEHGKDSQAVLITVGASDEKIKEIQDQVKEQGLKLPRSEIAKYAIASSYILRVKTLEEAIEFSNRYAPEHLIINVEGIEEKKEDILNSIQNAGSVFLGCYSPESCGDYASGTNHTLPTYGYARMYSGTNTGSFMKHITAQYLTSEGLNNIGDAVMTLAERESLEGHRNAVAIRVKDIRN